MEGLYFTFPFIYFKVYKFSEAARHFQSQGQSWRLNVFMISTKVVISFLSILAFFVFSKIVFQTLYVLRRSVDGSRTRSVYFGKSFVRFGDKQSYTLRVLFFFPNLVLSAVATTDLSTY